MARAAPTPNSGSRSSARAPAQHEPAGGTRHVPRQPRPHPQPPEAARSHQPTRRTSGTPTSRNTTSAERGLPGRPSTGTPPQSASSVGLPGRTRGRGRRPGRAPPQAAVWSRAPADEPADTTTRSSSAPDAASACSSARGSSGRSRADRGSPPTSRTSAASAMAVQRRAPGRAPGQALFRGHDLVAGRDDRHPRARVDAQACWVTPGGGEHPRSCARSEWPGAGASWTPAGEPRHPASRAPSPGAAPAERVPG